MTSVPKPLKFLRSHYKEMKDLYESIPAQNRNKPALADIISVMAITSGEEGARESLKLRCNFPTPEMRNCSPCSESNMHVYQDLSSLHVQYNWFSLAQDFTHGRQLICSSTYLAGPAGPD